MDRVNQSGESITLAVLAGGRGSRMGGAKAALRIGEESILPYLLHRLDWPGPTMLVTSPGRTTPPGAELFDTECVDPLEGQGPLRGLLTALGNAHGDIIAITVDMPAITRSMLDFLIETISTRSDTLGLMFSRRSKGEGNIEPFPCYFRALSGDPVAASIGEGRRSVHGLLRDPRFVAIEVPAEWPPTVWTNLNTPEDLKAFEKSLAGDDKM
jgi:molybdopterin-guanine dinucleotide biosynthesis protein A